MADTPGTLELIAHHLTLALRPLLDGLSDLPHFKQLMYRLGWKVTDLPPEYSNLAAAVDTAVTKFEVLSDAPSPADVVGLLQAVKNAYLAIQGITTAPPGVDPATFLTEIGERLFELLLTDYLALELPTLYNLLVMLNVIQLQPQTASAGRPSLVRVHFNWSQVPNIIANPQEIPKRTLTGHENRVNAVAVTPDGKRAVSASSDQTLKVWELTSGRKLRTLAGHSGWVTAVAVTPDGKRAISASDDNTLKVWDLDNGHELRTLTGHSDRVRAVAVTPDGQCAVSASHDGTLKVWELIGIGAAVTRRPLPHHRAYGSVHGGSSWLR